MSVSLVICYFPTEIRQIWGYLFKFFETFLGHWFTSFHFAWLSLHIDFWVSVCWSKLWNFWSWYLLVVWGSASETFWSCFLKTLSMRRNELLNVRPPSYYFAAILVKCLTICHCYAPIFLLPEISQYIFKGWFL